MLYGELWYSSIWAALSLPALEVNASSSSLQSVARQTCRVDPASYKPVEPREGSQGNPIKPTMSGYWALLGVVGKTWLPFPRLKWLI